MKEGLMVVCHEEVDGLQCGSASFKIVLGKFGTLFICNCCGQGYSIPVAIPMVARKAFVTKGGQDATRKEEDSNEGTSEG